MDAQRSPLPDFAPGEEALLADASGHTLGSVYVNPATLIAARIFSRKAEALSPDLLRARLKSALDLRNRLFPRSFYRLCHSEGDGLLYQAPLIQGQKTGWFYDQRCNREALAACVQGADMLDVCCYAGGFGTLAAAIPVAIISDELIPPVLAAC